MSQIAVAVTPFMVHRLGPNPTTALFPKLHAVNLQIKDSVQEPEQEKKGGNRCVVV